MVPVEAHLALNHIPLVGLIFGIVFFVAGLTRSSPAPLRAGLRIFVAMGIAVLPVVASGLVSADVLRDSQWLNATAVSTHQTAGILTLVAMAILGVLSGAALFASRGMPVFPRWVKTTVLVLAIASAGSNAWTAYLGGALRHSELGR